jgi:hypothetical protein
MAPMVHSSRAAAASAWKQRGNFNAGVAELRPVGLIATPLYSKLGLSEADLKAVSASIQKQVPAGRFGNPAE